MTVSLYTRFSGFYFFYYGTLGCFLAFWPLYLTHLQFDALEISQIMTLVLATGIIAPNLWAYIADRTGRRLWLVRLAAGLSAAFAWGMPWVDTFWEMNVVVGLFSFFWGAVIPLVEGMTMTELKYSQVGRFSYTQVRLWGSVGFITGAMSLALLTEAGSPPEIIPVLILCSHTAMFLMSLLLHSNDYCVPQVHISADNLLRHPAVLGLLVTFVLMQISHGAYLTFFSIYLESYGYSRISIGVFWSLSILGEILAFLAFSRYFVRHRPQYLFALAFLFAVVRWVILGTYPDWIFLLICSQLLHAATAGLYHAVSVSLLHRLFPGRMESRAQALYTSLNFGLGAALGAALSGIVWDSLGGSAAFYVSAAVALVGAVLGFFAVHHATPLDREAG